MILQAVIGADELRAFLDRFLPLRIDLEQGRWLRIAEVASVAIVAGQGVRATSSAELFWPIAGIDTRAQIPSLVAMLSPRVAKRPHGDVLEIVLSLEEADIARVPELLEPAIVGAINLGLERSPLVWDFTAMLSHRFEAPAKLGGISIISTKVVSGEGRVTDDALALALVLEVGVERTP